MCILHCVCCGMVRCGDGNGDGHGYGHGNAAEENDGVALMRSSGA